MTAVKRFSIISAIEKGFHYSLTTLWWVVMFWVVFGTLFYAYHGMNSFTSGPLFVLLHFSVIAASVYLAVFNPKGLPLSVNFLFIFAAAPVLHFLFYWIDAGKIIFEAGMFSLLIPYTLLVFMGGMFGGIYLARGRKGKIRETGLAALGYIEEAEDLQTRFKEGAHMRYKMRLTLRIETDREEPYTIEDDFWISEFEIHRVTTGTAIPVKVDPKDPKKVALVLAGV